ncbi:sporulation protein Cse60, partial [Enterococcus avium]|uniref:sporulation protein Cse60 n=2 Tax=Enterococcus avium TaxID=33945 RepID=UPI0035D8C240
MEEEIIMKRVKYFDEENPMVLEREINEFLSESDVSFIDIKFQSEKSSEGYGEEILHSVFLIYEEPA